MQTIRPHVTRTGCDTPNFSTSVKSISWRNSSYSSSILILASTSSRLSRTSSPSWTSSTTAHSRRFGSQKQQALYHLRRRVPVLNRKKIRRGSVEVPSRWYPVGLSSASNGSRVRTPFLSLFPEFNPPRDYRPLCLHEFCVSLRFSVLQSTSPQLFWAPCRTQTFTCTRHPRPSVMYCPGALPPIPSTRPCHRTRTLRVILRRIMELRPHRPLLTLRMSTNTIMTMLESYGSTLPFGLHRMRRIYLALMRVLITLMQVLQALGPSLGRRLPVKMSIHVHPSQCLSSDGARSHIYIEPISKPKFREIWLKNSNRNYLDRAKSFGALLYPPCYPRRILKGSISGDMGIMSIPNAQQIRSFLCSPRTLLLPVP
jgi:hypothetical protein